MEVRTELDSGNIAEMPVPGNETTLVPEPKELTEIEKKLLVLLKGKPATRDQLVKTMELPRTTIYDGLRKLMIKNKVKKNPLYLSEQGRGRPKVLFGLAV